MGELSKLPNIGADTERLLNETGIETAEQLRETGSKQAWLNIQAIDPSACYLRLCGLEGAIRNIPKKELPEDVKKELKDFYNAFKL